MAEAASLKLGELKALTYDTTNDVFYFTDAHKNDGYTNINTLKLRNDGSTQIKTIIKLNDRNVFIEDLVYDFNDDALFYSDRNNEKIMRVNFDRSNPESVTAVKELFLRTTGQPAGLELDACKRNLYFTIATDDPNINVISIKDKNAQPICNGKHKQPNAIALDESNDRIYIADRSSNIYFINSFTSEGDDFKVELKSFSRTPRSLAVDHQYVYYLDGNEHELRRILKHGEMKNTSEFFMKFSSDPTDVIVRSNFIDAMKVDMKKCDLSEGRMKELRSVIDKVRNEESNCVAVAPKKVCLHGGTFDDDSSSCICKDLRYDGDSCEIDLCYNFCLNGGECSMEKDVLTSRLIPTCSCTKGFSGDRCENDACSNYCLNSGKCNINIMKRPACDCIANFIGKRCENEQIETQEVETEAKTSTPATTSTTEDDSTIHVHEDEHDHNNIAKCPIRMHLSYVIFGICMVLSLALFLIILLVIRRFNKPMRPRIRKKFVVHKNIEPMTYRPTTEQCEVIIEDCCNMNICDTVRNFFKIICILMF